MCGLKTFEYVSDNVDAEVIYILEKYKNKDLNYKNVIDLINKGKITVKNENDRIIIKHKNKICTFDELNKPHYDTIRKRIKKLVSNGVILEDGYVETFGGDGIKIILSKKGRFLFELINEIYLVLDAIPIFYKNYMCNSCNQDTKNSCKDDYLIQLNDYIKYKNIKFDIDLEDLLGRDFDVYSLKEFIFWFVMSHSSSKVLLKKYPKLNAYMQNARARKRLEEP